MVPGGHAHLPEIQQLIRDGEPIKAHKIFGRHLMGYPVEQQKYQALASTATCIINFGIFQSQLTPPPRGFSLVRGGTSVLEGSHFWNISHLVDRNATEG